MPSLLRVLSTHRSERFMVWKLRHPNRTSNLLIVGIPRNGSILGLARFILMTATGVSGSVHEISAFRYIENPWQPRDNADGTEIG